MSEDYFEVLSDTEEEEEDDDNCQLMNYSEFHHNNNGSFTEHKVLSMKEVYKLMLNEIKKVNEVSIELSASKTRSLLNEYNWDAEKLLESILEGGQRITKLMTNDWEVVPCDIRKSNECQICVDEVSPKSMIIFDCKHRFCQDCLLGYLTVALKQSGLITDAIMCPGFKCKYELEDEFVLQLLKEDQVQRKYLQIIVDSFIQNNPFVKWCPNANCQRAVHLESFDSSVFRESVRCDCGIFFCFICHELSHDPIECSLLLEWEEVKAEDFEVKNWILQNTKPCPKCRVNIQKNGGCMHITCKCRYEFCWVCMGDWKKGHQCGHDDSVKPAANSIENVRRFSTYNAKHETMKQAYDLDVAQYKHKLDQGLVQIELEKQWIKVEFVAQAVEVLLQCRRTLMYSYIFSYFMTTIDNQMEIFEQNLIFLEQCTEQLSEVLENDVTAINVGMMKEKIIDSSALCEKHRQNLMLHINEGYDENWWRKFPIPVEELLAAVDENDIHGLLY